MIGIDCDGNCVDVIVIGIIDDDLVILIDY